jgi:hypothetical protein
MTAREFSAPCICGQDMPEIRCEGDFDLQSAGEQEDLADGGTAQHVHVVQCPVLPVHHLAGISRSADAQREIDV